MKSFFGITTLASATLLALAAQAQTFSRCAPNDAKDFTVTSATLSPAVPCHDESAQLKLTGSLTGEIVAGTRVSVVGRTLGNYVAYSDAFDLCDMLAAQGTPCPIAAGALSEIKLNFKWKSSLSNWPSNYTFSAINGNGNLLFCELSSRLTQTCPMAPATTATTTTVPASTAATTISPADPTAAPTTWTDCSNSSPSTFAVSSVALSPAVPCHGEPAQLIVKGSSSAEISPNALITVIGRTMGRVIYTDYLNVCDILAAQGTPCPVAAGSISELKIDFKWKAALSSWPTIYNFQAGNGNGDLMFCQRSPLLTQTCPM